MSLPRNSVCLAYFMVKILFFVNKCRAKFFLQKTKIEIVKLLKQDRREEIYIKREISIFVRVK
jgi:hypothetical protein